MSRTVYCVKLQKNAPGLRMQLIPGELGKRIFDNISQEAWSRWQKKQTMLINEKKLNMMNLEDQKIIRKAMEQYLFEDIEPVIEGYKPPSA